MYVNGLRVTRYEKDKITAYQVSINAYHVHITHNGEEIFSRGNTYRGLSEEWLDDKHQKITKALDALEQAILEATE